MTPEFLHPVMEISAADLARMGSILLFPQCHPEAHIADQLPPLEPPSLLGTPGASQVWTPAPESSVQALESQNPLGWKRSLRPPSPTSTHPTMVTNHIPRCRISTFLERFQGR